MAGLPPVRRIGRVNLAKRRYPGLGRALFENKRRRDVEQFVRNEILARELVDTWLEEVRDEK